MSAIRNKLPVKPFTLWVGFPVLMAMGAIAGLVVFVKGLG
jgi:hypothetical protein